MVRNKAFLLAYAIIGLAIIGVIAQLFTNTISFLMSVLMMIGFAVAFFALIYFFFLRRGNSSNDAKKYRQAVKQSKSKYNPKQSNPNHTASQRPQKAGTKKKRNKRASHLKVIDGNKSKRKNRASF
ncbi:SA1362 family protein [Lentibacillus cibarius]|uniref:Na+/H+ antiporter NhaA n=1 Tax=Lentibacillus cibarius TaxID=2583219 RepID=A0A5S3QG28_9BACI|nr:SA1362 family protein [Lentibacillus cibarius]TMN20788.1 Na+/H+ antiporter NhaA [Lentibacillus cibarius]